MSDAERTMQLALREGVFFALMLGLGEAFFVADAVRLGASALEVGLVVSLPLFLASLGPGLVLTALRRGVSRRRLAYVGATLQAASLAVGAIAELRQALVPAAIIVMASAYQIAGQMVGTAWSAWMGDVVPERVRGEFFARRARRVHAGTVVGLVAAAAILSRIADHRGFALLFGAAAVMRLASAACLWASPVPFDTGLLGLTEFRRELRSPRGGALARLFLVVVAMQLSVFIAAPYFTPFMIDTLGLSYFELTLATLAVGLASAASLPAWGRAIDRYGARSTFLLGALIVALVPVPWFLAQGMVVVGSAQAFSGLGWAAYEVGLLSLLLELTEPTLRPYAFAAVALAAGVGQLLGGLCGAPIFAHWGFYGSLGVTLVARLVIALALPRLLPDVGGAPGLGRRRLFLRVIGIRPNAGLIHRLLLVEPEPLGGDDEPGPPSPP